MDQDAPTFTPVPEVTGFTSAIKTLEDKFDTADNAIMSKASAQALQGTPQSEKSAVKSLSTIPDRRDETESLNALRDAAAKGPEEFKAKVLDMIDSGQDKAALQYLNQESAKLPEGTEKQTLTNISKTISDIKAEPETPLMKAVKDFVDLADSDLKKLATQAPGRDQTQAINDAKDVKTELGDLARAAQIGPQTFTKAVTDYDLEAINYIKSQPVSPDQAAVIAAIKATLGNSVTGGQTATHAPVPHSPTTIAPRTPGGPGGP